MRIVLLVTDGLQASAIGPYGNEWIETPHLNELAGASIVFDNHFADCPSHETPTQVRSCRHAFPGASGATADWFSVLQANGIAAAWITASTDVGREQVAAAIERMSRKENGALVIQTADLLPSWNISEESLELSFEDWQHESEPVPILDPRAGLIDANDELLQECLQRTYGAAIRDFDQFAGWIVAQLRSDDLLIVTAGAGQNLGEHRLVGDDLPWLYEELIHLPLMIRLPDAEEGGRRVSHLTLSLDVGPTIFGALGLSVPSDWHGSSLLPLCHGGPRIREYVCCGRQVGDRAELVLQTLDEKIIVPQGDPNRQPMYFVKPDDRWDVSDLRPAYAERAEDLERVLAEYVASSGKPGPPHRPPLPHLENLNANGETRRREHDQPESASGLRRHQSDEEGPANQ